MSLSNKGVSMRISPVITKLTTWESIHCLTRYICLTFLLCTVVAYPNQTLAADASRTQSKQMGGNETITGAFGIKFGEDINPYLEGSEASRVKWIPELAAVLKYKNLNPPINLKKIFTDTHNFEFAGISDDNNRVIEMILNGHTKTSKCEESSSVTAIRQILREKYKITKPQDKYLNWWEEYGDSEGNKIEMRCSSDSFNINFTSHLVSDYIARLKAKQQNQKDDIKKSLNRGM
jgi:hypothetical protein